MINSFNPVQLSAWRANVDMQYIVSRERVLQYCTKYVTKSEPHSQSLKEIFTNIVRGLNEGNSTLKVVQELLINTVGERDYSAQETCHLLLQLPMYKALRDFVILSLDGSHAVEDHLEEGQRATALSIVDHYMGRPNSPHFNIMTLSLPGSIPCPSLLGVNHLAGVDVLLSSRGHTSHQILPVTSMSSTAIR